MSEIHAFPSDQTAPLWEKINYLCEDPLPDGKTKKKIKGQKDLYRIRVGDYRVFYTFGDTWVRLLGIRRRDERTYGDKSTSIHPDLPEIPEEMDEENLDDLLKGVERPSEFYLDQEIQTTPLPVPITEGWLKALNIPLAYFPLLLSCASEEALLGVDVPGSILERIIDNLLPKSIEAVQAQPDFSIQETNDLVRFKEGELIAFLLRLDEDQHRLTEWALQGPTMVKGGAGTGKSTVALYRAKALLERSENTGKEKLLFTTYTRALISASEQLLEQLLAPEQFARVRVATCDEIALEIVTSQRRIGRLEVGGGANQVLKEVRSQFTPTGGSGFERRIREQVIEGLSDRYLLEEFEWIIDGRGIRSIEGYLDAHRPGRGHAFKAGIRKAVWELFQAYNDAIKARGLERFSAIRNEALVIAQEGKWQDHYDYVLVDEVQDLTPSSLCLMAEIAKSEEGLFFSSDSKQSLYSRSYSWSAVHPRLKFKGRTAILKRNYRSTAEIDRAAFDILRPEEDEELVPSTSLHTGPMPVLLKGTSSEEEGEWCGRFIRQMSRFLRMQLHATAVLVPSQKVGIRIAKDISQAGVPAQFFKGRELNLQSEQVKVITLHSAKGLEFPTIVVCGFEAGSYPVSGNFSNADVYQERMQHERRLLYVGMTRAMRGLMVVVPNDCEHEPLVGLNEDNWHVEDASS
jgi:superfamily I DNA/RNA helicase/mRNA-degrading endonuclease RelE of RelBE toxin-antitoxin system